MVDTQAIQAAKEHFGVILEQQLERVERLKQEQDWVDYKSVNPIIIGMLGGDGIGPMISEETQAVLEYLLRDPVAAGKVVFRVIEGLTIENRAAKMKSIPEDVLAERNIQAKKTTTNSTATRAAKIAPLDKFSSALRRRSCSRLRCLMIAAT